MCVQLIQKSLFLLVVENQRGCGCVSSIASAQRGCTADWGRGQGGGVEREKSSCVSHHHFKPLWFKLITEVKTKAGLNPF